MHLEMEVVMKNKLFYIATALLLTTSINVFAAETAGSYEDQINNNNQQLNELENSESQIQARKNQINAELNQVLGTIKTLSGEVDSLNRDIESKEAMITAKEKDIEAMEQKIVLLDQDIQKQIIEIKAQEKELAYQENVLSERVRAAYMYNSFNNVIYTLIESKSIVDFTERLMFIEKMAEKDHEIMEIINGIIKDLDERKLELEKDKKESQEIKAKLDSEKTALVGEKTSLEKKKSSLQTKLAEQKNLEVEKQNIYNAMSEEEKKIAQDIGDIMDENAALQASLQKLIREAQEAAQAKRVQEEKDRLASIAANKPVKPPTVVSNQTSGYIWPVSGRITSAYGYRIHPITGLSQFHTGIDIAASSGTPVKATRGGQVIMRQSYGGYGNCIIIDHGNGISSLYAHLSGYNVSLGQNVSQGQVIGYIGSTGASTGPHLHFEIRVNGSHTNPMNYLN